MPTSTTSRYNTDTAASRGAAAFFPPKGILVPPYDRELPPGYWNSINPPRPAAPAPDRSIRNLLLIIAGLLGVLAFVGLTNRSTVIPKAVTSYPTLMPVFQSQPPPETVAPVDAPRAIPRASLVHYRVLDSVEDVQMPDGRILTTRYKGELNRVGELPRRGASLGDMFYTRADRHAWVLAPVSAGNTAIGWVDP
jgi:hypothetical protein